MRVAIITPYSSESAAILARCINSVAGQSHAATHILVADGHPQSLPGDVQHIPLPHAHADWGDTPRLIGAASAYAQGFDGIAWLDADCWLEPDHVERMLDLAQRAAVSIVTTTRNLVRQDGSLLGICTESNGQDFCDTNCLLVMRDAIPVVAPAWGFKPHNEAVIGDRHVWNIARTLKSAHCNVPTVNYETRIANHYLDRSERPPDNARVIVRAEGEAHYRSVRYFDLVK